MLVDVVTEFADEVVRPAAAAADDACAAPVELLEASLEIGLPILGVPEALGGVSEERSAMAGTLVAEALGKGDMGLAVAALAPGSVATAIGLWGTEEQQQTYLPAFTGEQKGEQVPAAALALAEPTVLFDALTPATTATPVRRRVRARRREVDGAPRCRRRAVRGRRDAGRLARAVPHRVLDARPDRRGGPVDGRPGRVADHPAPRRRPGARQRGPRGHRRHDVRRVRAPVPARLVRPGRWAPARRCSTT